MSAFVARSLEGLRFDHHVEVRVKSKSKAQNTPRVPPRKRKTKSLLPSSSATFRLPIRCTSDPHECLLGIIADKPALFFRYLTGISSPYKGNHLATLTQLRSGATSEASPTRKSAIQLTGNYEKTALIPTPHKTSTTHKGRDQSHPVAILVLLHGKTSTTSSVVSP